MYLSVFLIYYIYIIIYSIIYSIIYYIYNILKGVNKMGFIYYEFTMRLLKIGKRDNSILLTLIYIYVGWRFTLPPRFGLV